MNKRKRKKIRKMLQDFSDELSLSVSVANIVSALASYDSNIQEADKSGLSFILAEMLKKLKIQISEIRVEIFGYTE